MVAAILAAVFQEEVIELFKLLKNNGYIDADFIRELAKEEASQVDM